MSASSPRILITGATDGIGRQTALDLAHMGAELILHGRDPEKLERVVEEARAAGRGQDVDGVVFDLARLEAVREGAERLRDQYDSIDVLLNNAGVYMKERVISPGGFEMSMAVNHFGHALLTHLLLDRIPSDSGRVINVSSIAHTRGHIDLDDLEMASGFSPYDAYAASKLANVLFTLELARRLPEGPTVNALHPGVVSTKLLTEGFEMRGPDSLEEGAATSVYLATSADVAETNGRYFVRKRETPVSPDAANPELARRFYEVTCERVGVEPLPA